MTDFNCMVGHWPYRKIRKPSFSHLKEVHEANGINCGYVSSINSIFYNDPFEGDLELHEMIKGSTYRHVLTVNPKLPGYVNDIEAGVENFDIRGVKIFPGVHGYNLDDPDMQDLCRVLQHHDLPLFLSMHLENERFYYLLFPSDIKTEELESFLVGQPDLKVLLLCAYYHELSEIKDTLLSHQSVYYDTSSLFAIEDIVNDLGADRMVYGSQHPLLCLKSTHLLVKHADLEDTIKQKILKTNGTKLMQRGD